MPNSSLSNRNLPSLCLADAPVNGELSVEVIT